jgi:CubicO group peptidase (beta-lactamase class C family)
MGKARTALAALFLLALQACSAVSQTAPRGGDDDENGTTGGAAEEQTSGRTPPGESDDPSRPPSTDDAVACAGGPIPAIDTSALDPFFTQQMATAKVPGLAVAVVGGGKIKWAKGYGFANVGEKKPVTTDTLFMLASVSKSVTATALMQLIEDPARGLSLDQDINAKLPFSVRNPRFAMTPITYRMLLTHTASLIDSNYYWSIAEPTPLTQGDYPTSLLDFEKTYVVRNDSWSPSRPGTTYSYSNTGAALIGLLVERISGKNLQDHTKAAIFDRIGMKESSWFLRGLDPSHVAMPYDGTPLAPQGHYGYPDYPAGQLRTSVTQLARFLLVLAGKGQCGVRLLKESTVAEMGKAQIPAIEPGQGLILYSDTKGGTKALGHNGGDVGVSTDMFFDPASGNGYVLLSNGSTNTSGTATARNAMAAMNDKLMQLARSLD